jgi:dGTPase
MTSAQSLRNERRHEKRLKQQGDHRTPAQRDRDRLLYSSAFRRLAEVTQVVAANSGYVFHNRLTHTLQVAQVGRRLAEKIISIQNERGVFPLDGVDADVVEAACLAHDLGHPPFGHVIEDELNSLAKKIDGFEGNAQSFRIVTKLAFHSPRYPGIDLTRATLCALMKYPWARGENPAKPKKWGYYSPEKEDASFARSGAIGQTQSTEAFLMDWADDITYSVHDLEDFYRAGRVPLHLLGATDDRERKSFFDSVIARHSMNKNSPFIKRIDEFEKAFNEVSRLFPPMQEYRGSIKQRTSLRNFTGVLISRYINATDVVQQEAQMSIVIDSQLRDEVAMLKELIWTYVINDPALATPQLGQRHMVKHLFKVYTEASAKKEDRKIFPVYYQESLEKASTEPERIRICVDLIASMTETQVYRIYKRVTGESTEASLTDPFR